MSEGFTLWFTGMSGAGKSTLAFAVADDLRARGVKFEVLDGDEVRTHLSKDLTFSKEDRDTNIRRIGWVCKLLSRNGVGAVSCAISPYREVREEIREQIPNFIEIYMNCPLETLESRDVKGLYKKARAGEIKNFTGLDDPYEAPTNPELVVDSSNEPLEQSVRRVVEYLEERGLVPKGS